MARASALHLSVLAGDSNDAGRLSRAERQWCVLDAPLRRFGGEQLWSGRPKRAGRTRGERFRDRGGSPAAAALADAARHPSPRTWAALLARGAG